VLVVVASRQDEAARSLVTRWTAHDARLLTCEDLSRPGWRYDPEASHLATAVVGGRRVRCREISGVLTRLACVGEWDLEHIAAVDRAYVAAEMTAFLLAWLSGLTCPVVNRPTPLCLSGPNWRPEQWTHAAAGLGIPIRSVDRRVARRSAEVSPVGAASSPTTVTVVGSRCLGTEEEILRVQARRLAEAAGVSLLGVRFGGRDGEYTFLGADLWPDPSTDEVAGGVLAHFQGAGG
jgi:hypothetical protein